MWYNIKKNNNKDSIVTTRVCNPASCNSTGFQQDLMSQICGICSIALLKKKLNLYENRFFDLSVCLQLTILYTSVNSWQWKRNSSWCQEEDTEPHLECGIFKTYNLFWRKKVFLFENGGIDNSQLLDNSPTN